MFIKALREVRSIKKQIKEVAASVVHLRYNVQTSVVDCFTGDLLLWDCEYEFQRSTASKLLHMKLQRKNQSQSISNTIKGQEAACQLQIITAHPGCGDASLHLVQITRVYKVQKNRKYIPVKLCICSWFSTAGASL